MGVRLNAQVLSNSGTFSVDFDRGCAPFTVNPNLILSVPVGTSVQYSYEGEVIPTLTTTHTYTDPGMYDIAQLLSQDAFKFDTLSVEVLEATVPSYGVRQCANNGLAITPFGGNYDQYRVFFTPTNSEVVNSGETSSTFTYGSTGGQSITVRGLFDGAEDNCGQVTETVNTVAQLSAATITQLSVANVGTIDGSMFMRFDLGQDIVYDLEVATNDDTEFQFVQSVVNTTNLTISGLNTEEDAFCFRLIATDICTDESFISNSVCTASLTAEANNGFHLVSWNIPPALEEPIEVLKDGEQFATITDPLQRSLVDSLVTCGLLNCYTINIDQGVASFNTPQACATGISIVDPPPVNDITATVEGDNVNLSWRIAENGVADTVVIRRARENLTLSQIATTTVDTYTDESPGVNFSSFTYDIFYADACGNRSNTSNAATTIFLQSENTTGNVYILSWTPYSGWFAGVANYFLQKLGPSGNLIEETKILSGFSQQIALTNLDREPVTYRIRAASLDIPELESFSNSLTFEFVPELFIPAAFTPNGDNLNDILNVEGTFASSLEFTIYNRWGEVIFFTNDRVNGWDGTIGQRKAASGTYVYSLDFTDEQGKKFTKRGTFVLIR